MKTVGKKLTCVLLLIAMIMTFIPAAAFAASEPAENGANVQITVPDDAKVFVGEKTGKHFVPFTEQEALEEKVDADNSTKTVYYNLPANKNFNYRISGENYVTYAGIFKSPKAGSEAYNLTVTDEQLKTEGKTPQSVDKDVTANKKYNVADIFLNINAAGHLKLSPSEEYQIVNLRTWQAVDSTTNNYFIEPDFHYSVIDFDGNPSDVVAVSDSGKITANKKGTAIVLVTYNAFSNASAVGGPFFGAIWPENTGVFVVSVDDSSQTIDINAKINEKANASVTNGKQDGNNLDSEMDVIYFLTELTNADGTKTEYDSPKGSYTFAPTGSGKLKVEVANPVYKNGKMSFSGFNAAEEKADGSFTVNLTEGRNIVKVSDDNGSVYQIITAKGVKATVNNLTNAGMMLSPGDQYSVVFDKIYHPANKLSGIYNMAANIMYYGIEGSENTSYGSDSNQYQFAANAATQTVSKVGKWQSAGWMYKFQSTGDASVPADYEKDTLTLSEGAIFAGGFGSDYGAHRDITLEQGAAPNLNASVKTANFGQLPDITLEINVTSTEEVESVEVVKEPEKTSYYEGDVFDPSGMELKVKYKDGKTSIITRGFAVSSEAMSAGTDKVTVNYGGKTADVEVKVAPLEVVSIEITTPPAKTSYTEGDNFDISGMVVTATYNNGSKKEVSDYTYTGQKLNKNDTSVTVIYEGKTAQQLINVEAKAPDDTDMVTVQFTLIGDESHGDNGKVHSYAEGTINDEWISQITMKVDSDAKVIDVFKEALGSRGIAFLNPTGNYITEINGLGQLDNGPNSGWMYTVNGAYPALGINEQTVKDGDVIVFHYTDDFSRENFDTGVSAAEVIAMIDEIPSTEDITLNDAGLIEKARKAFNLLSDDEKEFVSEIKQKKLNDAVAKIAQLKKAEQKKLEDVYKNTGNHQASLIKGNEIFGMEWTVIGLARAGRTSDIDIEKYYESIVKTIEQNKSEKLDKNKSTENSRAVLALTAIGKDASDIKGYNLLKPLANLEYVKKQGINGSIFALIAFDSHDYKIPAIEEDGTQTTRENLIDLILEAQLKDGGWDLSSKKADPDITAMAIQALAPYYNDKSYAKHDEVKIAVDKALECLSEIQNADGGYSSKGDSNSESCSQVITALTALGIDPVTDERFIKNGNSVFDALLSFYTGEGFKHVAAGGLNDMATDQAYYAIASYMRMADGKTSLYDMSDVNIKAVSSDVNTGDNNGGSGQNGQKDSQGQGASKTGDESGITMWILLALAGGAGTVLLKRKNEENKAA